MINSIRLNKDYYISREAYSRDEMYIGHRRLCACLSLAAFPHYCTDRNVRWRNGRGYPLVVHYWAGLQSVHGFRCYDRIALNAKCQRVHVLAQCLVIIRPHRSTTTRRQHPLTGQRAANFRLLANQWAERRLVTQWRHVCRAMRRSVCATQVLPIWVGPSAFRYQGNGATPATGKVVAQ